jgi:hypothetical protein
MSTHSSLRKPHSKPRMRLAKTSQPITQLEPKRLGWSGLADVIVKRAMIEEQAQSYAPQKAKKIRTSDAAIRLEERERQLWSDICSMAAEDVLGAPVTKEGGNSRRSKLMPIVERRLRHMFTEATSALLPGALLAAPKLGPETGRTRLKH